MINQVSNEKGLIHNTLGISIKGKQFELHVVTTESDGLEALQALYELFEAVCFKAIKQARLYPERSANHIWGTFQTGPWLAFDVNYGTGLYHDIDQVEMANKYKYGGEKNE